MFILRGDVLKKQQINDFLIQSAQDIILSEGLDALSIRKLARVCDVSVGYLYNHYKNKDALIAALLQKTYFDHLHDSLCKIEKDMGFITYLKQFFELFSSVELLKVLVPILSDDFSSHIKQGLYQVLSRDSSIDITVWKNLRKEDLIKQILVMFYAEVQHENPQFNAILLIASRTLYKGENLNEKND